ncbi:multiple epidermal growth factor-like domains protein 11, partial [Biomphalaria glabrata]
NADVALLESPATKHVRRTVTETFAMLRPASARNANQVIRDISAKKFVSPLSTETNVVQNAVNCVERNSAFLKLALALNVYLERLENFVSK